MKIEPSIVRAFRFPTKLWKMLDKAAKINGRTIAGEIIYRLQQSFKN